jgi:hypothetical protein
MKKVFFIFLFLPTISFAQGVIDLTQSNSNPLLRDVSGDNSSLGVLLNNIFYLVLAAAVVLAVFKIVQGGYTYMTSGDNADGKGRAKKMIQAALGGLLLAIGSILILNTINTNITEFEIGFPKLNKPGLPPEIAVFDLDQNNVVTYNELKGKLSPEIKSYLRDQIAQSDLLRLNPADLETFLTGGNTVEGWEALFHQMMLYESGFQSSKVYAENFNNDAGERTLSTGLLQLSYESTNYYGFDVTTESLKNPRVNIEAGVKILESQVRNHGSIGSYGDSYWSVLRPGSSKRKMIIEGLNN